MINITSLESLKNPIGGNSIYDLVPAFRLTIDDLTILHNDLIHIGNHITANQQQIADLQAENKPSDRTEQNYLITIGILLELCQTKTFTSQNQIINTITEQSIYGQGERILQDRFAKAIKAIDQARKARKK